MLEGILSSPAKSAQFVAVCSRLARHYGFQGWLLNIENKLDPSLVPSLASSLQSGDDLARYLHISAGPGTRL